MARIHHVKRAYKDHHGRDGLIKKGEPYYWVKLRPSGYGRGRVVKFRKRPRPSQLSSSKWVSVMAAREALEDWSEGKDALSELLRDAAQAAEDTLGDYQEGLDNMPEQLQEHAQDNFSERENTLSTLQQELDDLANEVEGLDEEDDDFEDQIQAIFEKVDDLDWDNPV